MLGETQLDTVHGPVSSGERRGGSSVSRHSLSFSQLGPRLYVKSPALYNTNQSDSAGRDMSMSSISSREVDVPSAPKPCSLRM